MNMNPILTKPYRVRSYETGPSGALKAVSLLNYLEDAASESANLLGVGGRDLMAKNISWVLSRLHLKVYRYPHWEDWVELRTWPYGWKKIFALREFELTDGKGEILAQATTSFITVDLEKKKPVNAEVKLSGFPLHPKRVFDDSLGPMPKINLDQPYLERAFHVRLNDLDLNRHVNNAVYVEWALESLPDELGEDSGPIEIEIAFRAETAYGDQVLSRSQRQEEGGEGSFSFLHQIVSARDGRELTRLRTRWKV